MFKKLEPIGFENESQSDSGRYTIFRNYDEALRNSVTNFGDLKTIQYGWPQKEWNVGEVDADNEVRLTRGKNVQYITLEEFNKAVAETKEKGLAKKIDAIEVFFKQFGVLHFTREEKDWYSWSDHALLGGAGGDMGTIWRRQRSFSHRKNRKDDNDGVQQIELEFQEHGRTAFMKFTKDGDFLNRDYNFDIEQFYNSQVQPDYKKVYDKFINAIRKFGPALKAPGSDDKLYYEKFALVIDYNEDSNWNKYELKLSALVPNASGSYTKFRMKSFKQPKKLVELTVDEVIAFFEEKYLHKLKPKFLADDELKFSKTLIEE